jgi:hypothetical protein
VALTSIKTQDQAEEYQEIKSGLISYIDTKIHQSLYNIAVIQSEQIKYNFNGSSIRYSSKLEEELINEMRKHYNIQKEEYQLTAGQKIKTNYKYTFTRLS